ncbi:hypothetical protein FGLOB1_7227 [Fusarium globosum]|uniref:Uncharacterized protein n=1 Tax=Fusarium globosum TaxID=78864 RepID=A0A8H6D7V7_9HYPO|nr:hypothetical protein FGLOB1_7227 [Fusarium globosum]
MASKANAECLLNTTECMLQTVASILNEIQEQNSEYNWDPLTFIFTAIIGVIAIAFAALTAFQAFLTAGPGRTKSGAYAIGPWSRHNYRKFDWSEMRFRTISSTPVLKVESLLKGPSDSSIRSHEEPGGLRKGKEEYFPATWLALLAQLSLDDTTVWGEVKLTGADFIPSELSAVPAYGSIRFVTILALILSEGLGRLTFDRESGLLRIPDRLSLSHIVYNRNVYLNEELESACLSFLDCLGRFRYEEFYTSGPLYLLMADIPDENFLPIVYPHKKAKLHERLDTLVLQSRSWWLKSLTSCDIFPGPLANIADSSLDMTNSANLWAKSTMGPGIEELNLSNVLYKGSSAYLNQSATRDLTCDLRYKRNRSILFRELQTIDSWLKQMEPEVLCRKLTLSIIGDGIRQIVNHNQQPPISEAACHEKNATGLSGSSELGGKLVCFLQAIKKPDCFNCLYPVEWANTTKPRKEVIHNTSEGLKRIWDIWQIKETPLNDEVGGNEDGADGGKEYKSLAWKTPHATHHPLDDVLIYRAVLITLL